MAKRHWIKSIEITAIIVFALVITWLAVTGLLSSTGLDHAWPYPHQ
ncbi:hypothetical protein [uncultured Pantoea sp.]|nr:hypothetical protein [uncultured Pantoea sp.]